MRINRTEEQKSDINRTWRQTKNNDTAAQRKLNAQSGKPPSESFSAGTGSTRYFGVEQREKVRGWR